MCLFGKSQAAVPRLLRTVGGAISAVGIISGLFVMKPLPQVLNQVTDALIARASARRSGRRFWRWISPVTRGLDAWAPD